MKTQKLKPCKSGQERNPKTNRCRKINSKTPKKNPNQKLKPCKPGQERNPITNRCRKAKTPKKSVEKPKKGFKPCKPGQRRNRITNRCRNMKSKKTMKVAVKKTIQESIEMSPGLYRLEFREGSSNKFWQIKLVGNNVHLNWGKIGSKGTQKVMKFETRTEAKQYIEKQMQSKVKKGYQSVTAFENFV